MGKDNNTHSDNINSLLIVDIIKGMPIKPMLASVKNPAPVVNTTPTNNNTNAK